MKVFSKTNAGKEIKFDHLNVYQAIDNYLADLIKKISYQNNSHNPLLERKILPDEYVEVVKLAERLGIVNGWMQGMESAENYVPDFSRKDPFSARVRRIK